MKNINQIRQLAFKIRSIADNDEPERIESEPEACFPKMKRLAEEILALLPCETCNGTGKVSTPRSIGFGKEHEIMESCPGCQPCHI